MTLRHSLDVEADGAVIEHGFDTGRRNRVSVWLYRLETALTSGITLALSVFLEYTPGEHFVNHKSSCSLGLVPCVNMIDIWRGSAIALWRAGPTPHRNLSS